MKLRSVPILTSTLCLLLCLAGGGPDVCRAQMRLTTAGRPLAVSRASIRLLKLPLSQKIDSVVHHLVAYARATKSQQRRYAQELAAHFAPSGYITVHQAGQPNVRLTVNDFLELVGNRSSIAFRFDGAEVVHYGQPLETNAGAGDLLTGTANGPAKRAIWQTTVTTYRNAMTFMGNRPQAADIATVVVPLEGPPPTSDYWQVFTLHLISAKSVNP